LLLLGLFLTVAGLGAGLFFFMNTGPKFACDIAADDQKETEKADRQLHNAKGKPEEFAFREIYEAKKRTAYISQSNCDQMKTQQTIFTIAGVAVSGFGFLLVLGGIGGFIFARKRGLLR